MSIVPERPNFPEEEEKVLKYWEEINAFQQQLEKTKHLPKYTFYDGPPFATGLPHYGHIAAGTIKDVVTRYATMKGHYVDRRFGWDCHGLPIEYEIDKTHNIKSSTEREAIGVKEYNKLCREIVMTYSKEWRNIVGRFGRWIDFDRDYKTMDCNFMESVWWTFKQIFDKGLVYRGSRIMPYSTTCNTVLSNFEAGSNYKDVSDPAIYISFPLVEDPEVSFIAWTTTPWTLPSNLAVAVNPKFTYLKIHDEEKNKTYIIAESRLKDVLKQTNIKKHKVIEKILGKDLEGKSYVPLFNYFESMKEQGCFKVLGGDFVTSDTGTGIVHCAPGFGEDDYAICLAKGIIQAGKAPVPVDADGNLTDVITDFKGLYIKEADNLIKEDLKKRGRLVSASNVVHSYPYCWRSNTPLIYRAIDTWFIKVTDIKDQLIENNKNSKWVPAFVQEKRFHNWLADAKDWCFSRNRYWGNPIPIWASEDMEEIVCIGSIKELQELSGCGEITDLHRESVDHITIPSKKGKGVLKRIPEVFDCWFESGSMPFAQSHYPFDISEEEFNKGFPANFIAEGLDQTRGWFYTLMVVSTAVKGREPFQNLIVNGIVLAEDGSKMSKSKKNYPDPMFIAHQFGADACRLYLCNSPVVRAEPLKFASEGVKGIVREVFLPWFNAYRFLIQNISRWEKQTGKNFQYDPSLKERLQNQAGANIMDQWIIAANQHLIKFVRTEMDNYRLYNVVKHMLSFLEQLTNWYVRLNRSRMKGEEGLDDQQVSLNTLFDVLLNTTVMMSCITPFITDYIYLNMRNGISPDDKNYYADSIHFLSIPDYKESLLNEKIEKMIERMQSAIEIGRKIRDNKNISLKTPLSKVIIVQSDKQAQEDLKTLSSYIKDELNCLEFEIYDNEENYIVYNSEPEHKEIGSVLKNLYTKDLKARIAKLSREEILTYLRNGKLTIDNVEFQEGWLKISKQFTEEYQKKEGYAVASSIDTSVMLVTHMDENLKLMGLAREVVNKVQKLRKSVGLSIDDPIEVFYTRRNENEQNDSLLGKMLGAHLETIRKALKVPFIDGQYQQKHFIKIADAEYVNPENEKEVLHFTICLPNISFDDNKIKAKYGQFNEVGVHFVHDIKSFLAAHNKETLLKKIEKNGGKIHFKLNGKDVELVYKEDFYLSANEMINSQRIPSSNSTHRNINIQTPSSANQVRARSVNAYQLNKSRRQNNSSYSQPTSTSNNNARSVSLNKKFAFNGNTSNVDQMNMLMQTLPESYQNISSLNNTTTHQQQQIQAFLANNQLQLLQSNSLEGNSQMNYNQPLSIQTPTSLHQQYRKNKHNKAHSMNHSIRGAGQPVVMQSSSRVGATQQYLNQPLQLNQRMMNQTLQHDMNVPNYMNYSTLATVQNHNNEPLNNYFQYNQSSQRHPNQNLTLNIGSNPANYFRSGQSPKSKRNLGIISNDPISTSHYTQNSYIYNPFNHMKQAQSSGRLSNSKMKNMNNTIAHARSFSNCSKRELSMTSRKGGLSQIQSSSIPQVKNSIPESQLLESEEYFEQGKVFLSDKKYKDAIRAYSKSLQLNKNNYDALFYRGVTYLDQGLPQKAIEDLNQLAEICTDYRKTMFIVLSIAYRRVNDYTSALRTLSKAIVKYSKYIEAYIARGQIYIFQKKWDKALSDFRIVINLQPDNGLGFLGQGDSLKGIGNYNGALLSYSQAIEVDEQCQGQGLMKRGTLYLQMKYSEQALEDFNKLTDIAEQQNQSASSISKAYFYKAKALKKTDNFNDAILHFEQVMRLADDQFLQSSALYEIAKIKIQQRDFYEAYYNLKRATHFKLKQKKLINYKIFTEGVIFLMKRKTKTGIKLLTSLLDKLSNSSQQTQSDYITPLIYIYRAYGYFVTDDYDKSLKDYIKSNQLKKLNNVAYYNMIMCQGLKSLEKKEYENAISFFTKSSQKLPGNRDPYFLRAVSIVRYALDKPIKPKTKNKMLRDAKRDLNRALKHSPKDYQVMYFRGILNFALHYFYDAITDFETVIEKSEDTSAKFYLARGRCYACLSMFKEAITDLSIAINLNKDLLDAYLNRGKCAYLIGDTGLAFMDFQKLIVLEPKNPMVHIYAGNLLMTTGSYEDATKAFTNADNIHKSPLALYQRSRCHVALNNMNDALKDLNKVIEISPNDKVAISDRECLNALKITSANGQTNPQPHEKAVYEKAIVSLTKLISYEKNEHLAKINHDSSIMHQHSQIIPSAMRTKTDKIKAIRRRKAQDNQNKQNQSLRKNDLRFRVAQDGDEDEQEEEYDLSDVDDQEEQKQEIDGQSQITNAQDEELKEEETNYYKENIFNKEDYYLYRAVMYFYAGEYEKSIQDFEQGSSIMHANKVLYPRNQFPDDESYGGVKQDDDNVSQGSDQTDLSDVGLCSLNIHEYSFNTILCLIQMKEYKKALTKLDYIIDTIPKKYASSIWLIRGIINQVVGHIQPSKKDFKRAYKYDQENATKYLDQKQSISLSVFPQQQRLCNMYANVKFQFPGFAACISMSPSFSFPFIKPPNMIPCVDNSVLEQFTIKAIPLKPEAPWIKKCSFGIKFTEEIYFTDDDREATPDEDKEYKKRKQQQQEKARAAAIVKSFSEKVILRNKIFMSADPPQQQEEGDEYEDEEFDGIEQIEGSNQGIEYEEGCEDENQIRQSNDSEIKPQFKSSQQKNQDISRITGKNHIEDTPLVEKSFLAELNKKLK